MKLIVTVVALLISLDLSAQFEFPSLSPEGKISQHVGYNHITIEYERPSVRGRKIFGGLVPWGKVWRTGAGCCTTIIFDKPVKVANQSVPAGKYSLFTIPDKDEWIIIFNTNIGSKHDHQKDIARFVVRPRQTVRHYEALTIDIDIIPNNARIYISWKNTQVYFDVQTATDETVEHFIREELLTGKSEDADQYAMGAQYFLFQNAELYDALELAEKAITIDKSGNWAIRLKMEIYEKLRLYQEALAETQKGIEIEKSGNRDTLVIQYWEEKARHLRNKLEEAPDL